MIDTSLKDREVIVTGANKPCGIGAAIAKAFAAESARVFITYFRQLPEEYGGINSVEVLQATEPGLPFTKQCRLKLRMMWCKLSVTKVVKPRHGKLTLPTRQTFHASFTGQKRSLILDVLVNNAANDKFPETIFTTVIESIDRHFAVNNRTLVLMVAEFVRRYKERDAKSGELLT